MNDEGACRPVLGHICSGLARYQTRDGSYDSNCVPIFGADGTTMGCDDTNYAIIVYCPFCGIKLQEARNE